MTIDFGDVPCTVPLLHEVTQQDYRCSGSATGTATLLGTRTIELTFDELSCNGVTLNGSVEATYDIRSSGEAAEFGEGLYLSTTVDLTVAREGRPAVSAAGNAEVAYVPDQSGGFVVIDSCEAATTIGGSTYQVTMNNVRTSVDTFGNWLPYAGEIQVIDRDGNVLTVTFDSNTPLTGEVTVGAALADAPGVGTWPQEWCETLNILDLYAAY